jgi:hypothetical protein
VERLVGVLREAMQEELEKGVDVFSSDWAGGDSRAVVGVGVANVDRLVEEYYVCKVGPAVRVEGGVLPFVSDAAWPKFEK